MRFAANASSRRCSLAGGGAAAGHRPVSGLAEGIEPLLDMCTENEASGNLMPDADTTTAAQADGCAAATFDRDSRRFDGVRAVTP